MKFYELAKAMSICIASHELIHALFLIENLSGSGSAFIKYFSVPEA